MRLASRPRRARQPRRPSIFERFDGDLAMLCECADGDSCEQHGPTAVAEA